MTKLNDTQCMLLSTASRRDDGSIYPLPATIKPGGGTVKAGDALLSHGLAEERETNRADAVRRADGDIRYGVFITNAGTAAIGLGEVAASPVNVPAQAEKAPSKTTMVLALLARENGATLPELIEATGWLPHTTRAALTGIRKRGHQVERTRRDGVTCYRIVSAG